MLGLTDANQVKPMAQVLTLATPLVAVPSYFRQCRLVLGLAFILASGGLLGALVGSRLSMHYLSDLSDFKPVFAILVLFIAAQLAWSLRPQTGASGASARAAGRLRAWCCKATYPAPDGRRAQALVVAAHRI